jgi:aryl-alcohol dehydrogenase-like predicted oxidoreductase
MLVAHQRGNSRRWIRRAVEDSLRRLRPTTATFTRCTGPVPTPLLEETLSALTDLVRDGKVLYIGASTVPRQPDRGSPAASRGVKYRDSGDAKIGLRHGEAALYEESVLPWNQLI